MMYQGLIRILTTGPSLDLTEFTNISSFNVGTEEPSPLGLVFKPDGTGFYISGRNTGKVFQYSLSTPWLLGTASYSGKSFVASNESPNGPRGISMSDDGTRLYTVGDSTGDTLSDVNVYEYVLSTPWDITTASYSGTSLDVSSQSAGIRSITFSPSGSLMFLSDPVGNFVLQYNLGSPWDLGSSSYSGKALDVSSQTSSPHGMSFSQDGLTLLVVASGDFRIFQYDLSSPFDVSTGVFSGNELSVLSEDSDPTGIYFDSSTSNMYIAGDTTNDIYMYTPG